MKITAEPRSDQWNADDFVGGPRTFTVAGVRAGTAEQKYDIVLEGHERVWRPPLTVLRILIKAWGDEAASWAGRRATLYRDDTIRFGRDAVGGVRVSHLSHLSEPLEVKLTEKRGARATHVVQPLLERDWLAELEQAAGDVQAIGAIGQAARDGGAPERVMVQIRAEYERAKAPTVEEGAQ